MSEDSSNTEGVTLSRKEIIAQANRARAAIDKAVDGVSIAAVLTACSSVIMCAADDMPSEKRVIVAQGLARMAQDIVNSIEKEAQDNAKG